MLSSVLNALHKQAYSFLTEGRGWYSHSCFIADGMRDKEVENEN